MTKITKVRNRNFTINIIMYHYVKDFLKSEYKKIKGLDINEFEYQLNYFKNKFYILDPLEVRERVIKKEKFNEKDVWLTFDDGYKDHYTFVFPLLTKYSLKGSFFPPVSTSQELLVICPHSKFPNSDHWNH